MGNVLIQSFIILFLIAVGWVGHWAFTSLDTDSAEVSFEEAQQQFDTPQAAETPATTEAPATSETQAPDTETEEEEEPDTNQYADLIANLEELRTDQVYMRSGSQGSRVGVVQEFLDVYFDRSITIDNDYGPGTSSAVREFQQAEGLSVDGQAGPNTYTAMIEWLESNG